MELTRNTSVIFLFVLGLAAAKSWPLLLEREGSQCTDFFTILRTLRDNALVQFGMEDLMADQMGLIESYLGISLNDDTQLHQLACQLVESSTVEELSSVVRLPPQVLENYLKSFKMFAPQMISSIREQKEVILILRAWLVDSGFPDTWPLKTSYKENVRFLKSTDESGVVFFDALYNEPLAKKAKILTGADSFQDFLKEIQVDPSSEKVQEYVKLTRFLASDGGDISMLEASDLAVELFQFVLRSPVVQNV